MSREHRYDWQTARSGTFPDHPPYKEDLEHIAVLREVGEAEDAADLPSRPNALAIYLLSRNYHLTPKDFQEILEFAPGDPVLAEMQRSVHEIAIRQTRVLRPSSPTRTPARLSCHRPHRRSSTCLNCGPGTIRHGRSGSTNRRDPLGNPAPQRPGRPPRRPGTACQRRGGSSRRCPRARPGPPTSAATRRRSRPRAILGALSCAVPLPSVLPSAPGPGHNHR